MKCMTVKEIDELLEQMSKKNQEEFEVNNSITEAVINPNIDEEIHKLLKEIEILFKEKTNKKNYVKDEIFCSF